MHPLPLNSRATAAVAMLALTMLGAALSFWADAQQTDLLQRVADGDRVSFAELDASDDRVAWTAIVYIVGGILAAITFLLWYSRAYRNVLAMGRPQRFGPRWAVWYWFIPIVNLFAPKQVMNDIWRGSANQERVPALMHWWWGCWLLSVFIDRFAFRSGVDENDVDELITQSQAYMFSDVFNVVTGVLAVLVVRRITARNEARRLAGPPLPADGEREGEGRFPVVDEPAVQPQP